MFSAIQTESVAQSQVITAAEFWEMQLRVATDSTLAVTFGDLYSARGHWTKIEQNLNIEPLSSNSGSGVNYRTFKTTGILIDYSDYTGNFELLNLEITNADFDFYYQGLRVKVGDPISRIGQRFSEGYNSRHVIPDSTPARGQVVLDLMYTGTSVSFEYDTTNDTITKIQIISVM